jgi:hypothetical protein
MFGRKEYFRAEHAPYGVAREEFSITPQKETYEVYLQYTKIML